MKLNTNIRIRDTQDEFVQTGNKVTTLLPDDAYTDEFTHDVDAYVALVSRMFYDHQSEFASECPIKTKYVRDTFDMMVAKLALMSIAVPAVL